MKKTKELLIIVFIMLICLFTANIVCYAEGEMTISDEALDLEVNQTKSLSISNKPYGESVEWKSSNENVATVDTNGRVTAVGIGTAVITATIGEQTFNCSVLVKYNSIDVKSKTVGGTGYILDKKLNLVLEKYPSKQLLSIVKDHYSQEIPNATVTWTSSKNDVATVDNTGKLTALSVGTTTITATADTVSEAIEVTVLPAPQHTDFSNATYELPFDYSTSLKISGIIPQGNTSYYYMITTDSAQPTIEYLSTGDIDLADTEGAKSLSVNLEEKYIFSYNIDEYVELNSDMYLWVVEVVKLEDSYVDDNEKYIRYDTKIVVSGEQLIKPALPKLNDIFRGFAIGQWETSDSSNEDTWIRFRFPSATENRKFTLKIGKVTDQNILNKIHNNDYSGITTLLSYAKNDTTPLYNNNLVTTSANNFTDHNNALFDGGNLLAHKAFYYLYAKFDDENGKYVPVECVTLAQAYVRTTNSWDLYAFSDEKVEWTNISSTPTTDDNNKTDDTTATKTIPYTGEGAAIISIIGIVLAVGLTAMVLYRKNSY